LALQVSTFPVGVVGTQYPLQILTATGGIAPYLFSIGNGALPGGLSFASPQFTGIPTTSGDFPFTVTVTDSAGNTASAASSILINPVRVDLILSQSTVSFALTTGSQGLPTPASVTVRSSAIQQILNYAVTVSPAAPWLNVLGGGTTPGSIQIGLSPAALTLPPVTNGYQTTVTATCVHPSPCAGIPKNVVVSLNVSTPAPAISLTDILLSFSTAGLGAAPESQWTGIQNSGSGILAIQSVSPAESWLSVTGVPASLPAGPAAPILVTVNPAGLAAGFYTSQITFSSGAGSAVLPVNLRVAPNPTINLAPSGALFQTTAGGPLGNPNGSFLISSPAGSPIAWQATVLPGAPWLSLGSTEGTASAVTPGLVSFSANPSQVSAGHTQAYYGVIRITSSGVVNSPVDFEVVLDMTAPTTPVTPDLSPPGLIFNAATRTSQTVQVFAGSATPLPYQASAATQDGGSWLSISPQTGVASAAAPGQSLVTIDATGLKPGVYRGGASYAFDSDSVRTVNVTLLVLVPAPDVSACAPVQLIPTQVGLPDNYRQPVGWPAGLAVQVITDCGTPAPNAQVTVSFSNGDPPLALTSVDGSSGLFAGTWTPRTASPQVTVTAAASGLGSMAVAQITGEVANNSAPLLDNDGIVDAFRNTVGDPLAPGSLIQIFGSNLATTTTTAGGAPLPLSLAATSVSIGGLAAPLFYASPGQINAQVPFELAAGHQYDVQVNVNGALSATEPIALVNAAPAIAAFPSGEAIAQHADYSLVSDTAPAQPGEYIILYLSGLGRTDLPVASGAASPANPLAHPVSPVVLTINGNPAVIAFAGLTPLAVGLYQINFQLPDGVPGGMATIVVSQPGAVSNSVTLPVSQ
jgi:adhesin/invasin